MRLHKAGNVGRVFIVISCCTACFIAGTYFVRGIKPNPHEGKAALRRTARTAGSSEHTPATQSQKLAQNKSKKLTPCNLPDFSVEELNQMCSAREMRPLCLVDKIDHLNQRGFVQAKLQLPGGHLTAMVLIKSSDYYFASTGAVNWELHSVGMVLSALKWIPGSALIDIGSNLGVYSLSAAAMGYKVLAVDASYNVAMRLRKSAEISGFTDILNVHWNAMSAASGTVKLFIPMCEITILTTHTGRAQTSLDPIETAAVGLDDVTLHSRLLKNVRHLVIKIDIEGSEWNVFATGEKTFQRFNVSMVLMEWEWTAAYFPQKTEFITNFLTGQGFTAHEFKSGRVTRNLVVRDRLKWPPDVMWLHKSSGLKEKLAV